MTAAAIAHDEIQISEGQYGRAAQLIVPAHLGVANNDFALGQQPVGEPCAGLLGIEFDAGDVKRPRPVTAYIQIGLVQGKRMKTQGAERERIPGQGAGHRRQRQGYTVGAVVQPQFGQREVGAQTLPAGIDAADADALADIVRNRPRDEFRMLLDVRQNPETQRQHHRGKAEIGDEHRKAGVAQ
jgi:hypothetical protein